MARTGTVLDEVRTVFPVLMAPGGLIKSSGESVFETTLYLNGTASTEPITITEIASSGDYLATFTPTQPGYWYLEIVDSKGGVHIFDYDIGGTLDSVGVGSNVVHMQILTPTASVGTNIKVRKPDRSAVVLAVTNTTGDAYFYLNPGNYIFDIYRSDGLIWPQAIRKTVPDAVSSEFDDLADW